MNEPKKVNASKLFLPQRLINYLKFMETFPFTIIDAPSGWGKLSCVREYFRRSNVKPSRIFWATFPDSTPGQCWFEISNALTSIDPVFSKKNAAYPPPFDAELSARFIGEMTRMKVQNDCYIVIDSPNFLNSIFHEKLSMDIMQSFSPKIHLIILADYISHEHKREISTIAIHYITKDDLALTPAEIADYFASCGITVSEKQAGELYLRTYGHIFQLSMYAHYYADHGEFPQCDSIFELIQRTYWDKLTGEMRLILYSIHRFEWFVASQARYIIFSNPLIAGSSLSKYNSDINFSLDEKGVQELMPQITAVLPLVKLDGKRRKYYMHDILKSFVTEKFDGMYPDIKFAILRQVGNWYANDGNVLDAIKCYYDIHDYKSIYALDFKTFNAPVASINRERELFLDLVTGFPLEKTQESICIYIYLCTFLLILNEGDMLKDIYARLNTTIAESGLDDDSRAAVRSMLTFYGIFANFNDILKMRLCILKSREMNEDLKGIIIPDFPWTMNTPSVFYVFHSRIGNADKELEAAKQIQQNYVRLTHRKESGAVSLIHAELLFQRGRFEESAASAARALSLSLRMGRVSLQVCTHLCTAGNALVTGDFKAYIRSIKEIKNINQRFSTPDIKELCELCMGVLECITRENQEIPLWLQHGETRGRNTHSVNIPYINMIYGNHLVTERCYNKYLAIHDTAMFQAENQKLILPRIYFNIYASICYAQLGDATQALIYMRNALDMSLPDELYMPFAENYPRCMPVVDGFRQYEKYNAFVDRVRILSASVEQGITIIKSALASQVSETVINRHMSEAIKEIKMMPEVASENKLGLSQKEYEVARLAASRMSNRAIADELYTTESNVKYIMKHVFVKLGIKSRFELMQFFG